MSHEFVLECADRRMGVGSSGTRLVWDAWATILPPMGSGPLAPMPVLSGFAVTWTYHEVIDQ